MERFPTASTAVALGDQKGLGAGTTSFQGMIVFKQQKLFPVRPKHMLRIYGTLPLPGRIVPFYTPLRQLISYQQ